MSLPRIIVLSILSTLLGGCAANEPNKVTKQYVGLDGAERFGPVYHKTYVTIRPLEIWTFDVGGEKGAILAKMRTGDCYTDKPSENVAPGTHLFVQELVRIHTAWREYTLGEERYPVAKVLDGAFAGWIVQLSNDILIDPQQQSKVPPHLTWIPNLQNIAEDPPPKAATQP